MRWAKRFGISRFFQALWIGIIAAGLMLGQVSAAAVSPELPSSKPQTRSQVELSPTGRYFIFFEGQSALQSTKANKGQIQSALVQNQVAGVRAAQVQQLKVIEKLIGRKLPERKHFDLILNAVAVGLSLDEAELIAAQPGVKAVQPVRMAELATDTGPTFVGADLVWSDPSLVTSKLSMGEGVIIGVLDTGINFDHPSFASDPAISGDTSGYLFPDPPQYFGVCQTSITPCNDKLIGAYYMRNGNGTSSNTPVEDITGHGSHTASIAAGNRGISITYIDYPPKKVTNIAVPTTISGMAPHAQLISYYVCDYSMCSELDLVAGVQQAILDDVDVINYSISSEVMPYYDPVALAFLEAYKAGIFVSAAAGNSPDMDHLSHQAPWVSTVAATSHDRQFVLENKIITQRIVDPVWGDIRAIFSWQGPADHGLELLKPDLAAPGGSGLLEDSILAAFKDGVNDQDHSANAGLMSGTSMSTPFVAGAAALIISAHPDWSPAEVKSALMLTAKTAGLLKNTFGTSADPFDIGSGRIQVNLAVASGLVMDESAENMTNANPASGGDPKTLNLPTMQNNLCFKQCSWIRTLRSVSAASVTYKVKSPSWVSVEPSKFTLSEGATQTLKITARENGVLTQKHQFAQIDLIPDPISLPPLHLTAAVLFTPVTYYYFPIIGK